MKNKELNNQLVMLKSLGLTEDSPEYKDLEVKLKEVDKIPKKDWNNTEIVKASIEKPSS